MPESKAAPKKSRADTGGEKETMPVIVCSLDDDAATIIMVDSNLQRETMNRYNSAVIFIRA